MFANVNEAPKTKTSPGLVFLSALYLRRLTAE